MSHRQRERRFDRVEIDIVWAAIGALDEALKHELLRELATELASRTDLAGNGLGARIRQAIACLRDAADILGHSPSVKEYRLLQAQPELNLIPDGTLRNWLGGKGWADCLSAALLDSVSDGDYVSTSNGTAFSRDEIHVALRDCRDALGRVPVWTEYVSWARRPEVRALPGRRPRGIHPFLRFEGYQACLVAAGVLGTNDVRYGSGGRVIASVFAFSAEERLEALRYIAGRLGHSPRTVEYQKERNRVHQQGVADRPPLPTVQTIMKSFPTWDDALIAAGLPPLGGRATGVKGKSNPRRPFWTREEKLDFVRQAWIDKGQRLTKLAYRAWRDELIAAAVERDQVLWIPAEETIAGTFGGWRRAVALALPGGTTSLPTPTDPLTLRTLRDESPAQPDGSE